MRPLVEEELLIRSRRVSGVGPKLNQKSSRSGKLLNDDAGKVVFRGFVDSQPSDDRSTPDPPFVGGIVHRLLSYRPRRRIPERDPEAVDCDSAPMAATATASAATLRPSRRNLRSRLMPQILLPRFAPGFLDS